MLLHEKLQNHRLILASRSPRRRELLAGCDLHFDIAEGYEVEEVYPETLAAEKVPEYLSGLKADGYPYPLADGDILITADTVVISRGRILGKPHSREEAMEMIRELSGRTHLVVTGVSLRDNRRSVSFSAESKVSFRELSDEEIAYYVDTYKPFDKAGAYGIQEWIGRTAIESIEGSFYNVMGLPVAALYKHLASFV
ncbi:MAG: septum formation protein Maf [Rikenellaceae bacterium]|nr:septum formation protein Maf [Rikenellaceae bacterium]